LISDFYPDDLLNRFFRSSGYRFNVFRPFRAGIEWSLLSVGSGLLIGLNVSLSLLAASIVVVLTGPILIDSGIAREIVLRGVHADHQQECARLIDKDWETLTPAEQAFVKENGNRQASYMQKNYFSILITWYMWPATALMITSAITAVLLRWRSVVESFRHLRLQASQGASEDVSLTTIIAGSVLLTGALAVVQRMNFGMSYEQTAVAVICSLPLILVGIRVLGETNNGPISVMMNGLQAVFAVFWQSNVGHNLIAAGMAGLAMLRGKAPSRITKRASWSAPHRESSPGCSWPPCRSAPLPFRSCIRC